MEVFLANLDPIFSPERTNKGLIQPPGLSLDTSANDILKNPAMAQALATLGAVGNLTPLQLQQIQNQLKINTHGGNSWPENPRPAQGPPSPKRENLYYQQKQESPQNKTSPTVSSNDSHTGTRSAILEDFRNGKLKKFELKDIVGHAVEFSGDQHGSRFIQQKLETATLEEKEMVFSEILSSCIFLTTDVFGNYVIQKFFEYGTDEQKRLMASKMEGNLLQLSLQMYGCRVVQKVFFSINIGL